jgi:phosphohistidine phosphatase SixA
MHLWILRHGEAERHTQRDSERQLTALGEADARTAGAFLANSYAGAPEQLQVLASPYKRAQQTAQCVLGSFPGKQLRTVEWLTPDIDPLVTLKELEKLNITVVLLVSHQPLGRACGGLVVAADFRVGPAMGTASLAEFALPMVAKGCATLASLRHPPDYQTPVP